MVILQFAITIIVRLFWRPGMTAAAKPTCRMACQDCVTKDGFGALSLLFLLRFVFGVWPYAIISATAISFTAATVMTFVRKLAAGIRLCENNGLCKELAVM